MTQQIRRETWLWFGKAFLAGVIAFTVLTVFCAFYYNMSSHLPTPDGATDYRWLPHDRYSVMYEGYGHGRTNNEGYNNTFDYVPGMPVDILVLGSSHMEGLQVSIDDLAASRLNEMLPDRTVYNLGMQKHAFLICAGNLPAAVEKYRPTGYVIVEMASLRYPDEQVRDVLMGTQRDMASYTTGILNLLQKNQYLRLVYRQVTSFLNGQSGEDDTEPVPDAAGDLSDQALFSELLSRMREAAGTSGAKLILAYHPGITLNKNGSIEFSSTKAEEGAFAKLCEENDILFLNMRDRFLREYEQAHLLPYGFANSSAGSGHMNREGHRMLAEELYDLIQEDRS